MSDFESFAAADCARLEATLIAKHRDYGQSGLQSPVLAPELTPYQALCARASDKVARIAQLNQVPAEVATESLSDSWLDLAGYAILARSVLLGGDAKPVLAPSQSKAFFGPIRGFGEGTAPTTPPPGVQSASWPEQGAPFDEQLRSFKCAEGSLYE